MRRKTNEPSDGQEGDDAHSFTKARLSRQIENIAFDTGTLGLRMRKLSRYVDSTTAYNLAIQFRELAEAVQDAAIGVLLGTIPIIHARGVSVSTGLANRYPLLQSIEVQIDQPAAEPEPEPEADEQPSIDIPADNPKAFGKPSHKRSRARKVQATG